jgi:CRISPR/Cas system-associated protein Cas7 (RAMP superfamily)
MDDELEKDLELIGRGLNENNPKISCQERESFCRRYSDILKYVIKLLLHKAAGYRLQVSEDNTQSQIKYEV